MNEQGKIMHEFTHGEYAGEPDPEGSRFFTVCVKETLIKQYRVKNAKTIKEVREQFEEYGTEDWIDTDYNDWDGERISSIERVDYSPCTFIGQYLSPPKDRWSEDQFRYWDHSTLFDTQPPRMHPFDFSNAIRRPIRRCKNYVLGKTSVVCERCVRNLQDGMSFVKKLEVDA